MRRGAKGLIGLLVMAGLFALGVPVRALETFPFSAIKPGMKGEGKTVFKGHKVETFTFEVIDVMEDMGPSGGGLILFRGTSENLRQNAGVSQGMSGSPMYINGKLAAAVSLAFPLGDPMVGGATPIGEMLEVLSVSKQTKPLKTGYTVPGYGKAVLARAPVFVAGASPRAREMLERQLFRKQGGVQVLAAASGGGAAAAEQVLDKAPEPGSMLIVGMLMGDAGVYSAGTVTAVLGGRVLAFGHSFRRVGPVSFFMGRGEVVHIMKNLDVPYKVTRPTGLYGRMDEDRGVAMIGTLRKYPDFTRVKVKVHDNARGGLDTESYFRVVRDKKVSLEVTRTAVFSALDKALDRIGEGTSTVSFSVRVKGRKKPIERTNTYYNPVDIAAESVRELDVLMRFFTFNEFEEVGIENLELNVTVDAGERAMVVKRVALVEPGKKDKDGVEVTTEVGGGQKVLTIKKSFEVKKEKTPKDSFGGAPMADDEDEDGDAPPVRKMSGGDKQDKGGKEPSITIHPGQSFKVKVTLLPYREKPVTRIMKVKMDRKKYPPGDYAFTVGGPEAQAEEEGKQDDAPLSFDDALKEFHELRKNDELVLECRNIVTHQPGPAKSDKPDKEDLRQIMKINGFSVSGKRNFRVTVKNRDKIDRSSKIPRRGGPVKKDPPKVKKAKDKPAGRKSRLDPPKKKSGAAAGNTGR